MLGDVRISCVFLRLIILIQLCLTGAVAPLKNFPDSLPPIFENGNFFVSLINSPIPEATLNAVNVGELSRHVMTAAHGESYACFLPIPGVVPAWSTKAGRATSTIARLTALLSHEDRPCAGRKLGEWTYEVCGGDRVDYYITHIGEAPGPKINIGLYEKDRDTLEVQVCLCCFPRSWGPVPLPLGFTLCFLS